MRPSVAAVVLARDDARTLDRCLASLAFADECLVVVDERSRDGSEGIARARGARVVRRPYEGNVEQKNFALSRVKSDFVLALDADEALSPELAAELPELLARRGAEISGVLLDRVTFHLGRWLRHGDFHPDWQLRLFRRAGARWEGRNPHGRVRLDGAGGLDGADGLEGLEGPDGGGADGGDGRVVRARGPLLHWSYADLADQVARIQAYSGTEAERLHAAGRRARARDLVLRPPARFLRAYLGKRGFLDGVPGFVVAAATAFHVLLKYAKLWERQRAAGPAGGRDPGA